MAHERKEIIEEPPPGAPEWMVTFCDCMTLLLTFFVLLLTFSSFDKKVKESMETTMFKDLDQVFRIKESLNSVVATPKITEKDNIDKGSEKPTIGEKENTPKQTPDENFRERKVFITPSATMFWGNGTTISNEGMEILDNMAAYCAKIQGKIVLSENGDSPNNEIGIERALNALNYIVERGVKEERLSLSVDSILSKVVIEDYIKGHPTPEESRRFEVVILERSAFN
ncbi:MAG TPA: flagellar motor protein MotB [Sedimentisphaerales bacterium]|nr:flagellar motor protein MotB [Sedimentisphaerales bacterium]